MPPIHHYRGDDVERRQLENYGYGAVPTNYDASSFIMHPPSTDVVSASAHQLIQLQLFWYLMEDNGYQIL